jgi:hypothetical protein
MPTSRTARVSYWLMNHPAMLTLTAQVLSGECLVVGSVGDGCELLAEPERLHPAVVVLEITVGNQ